MPTRTRWAKWISVVAALAWLLGPQGATAPAAAQPAAVPQAWPPGPSAPLGFIIAVPPNCQLRIASGTDATKRPISDFGTPGNVVTATVVVTQSLPYVWTVAAETIITHTYSGDLNIRLISPAGTTVTLSHRNGNNNSNVFSGTVWSDFYVTPATDAVYQNNVTENGLVPEEAMGAFQGENGTGAWKLVVADEAGGDVGQLNGFLLEVLSLNEAPITQTDHFSHIDGNVVADGGSAVSHLSVGTSEHGLIKANLTTNISHTKPGQLIISLQSPLGLTTTISSQSGDSLANWFAGTVWDDQAGAAYPPGPVTLEQAVYPTSPLTSTVPEGAMGHFLAIDPNGQWTLHVHDLSPAPGFTLNSWGLDVTTGHCLAHQYLPLVRR